MVHSSFAGAMRTPAYPLTEPYQDPSTRAPTDAIPNDTSSSRQARRLLPSDRPRTAIDPQEYIPTIKIEKDHGWLYDLAFRPPDWVRWTRQIVAVSAVTGFLIGSLRQGRKAGLRFTAENSHRKPKTMKGWYFYKRTKNYWVGLGAVRGGVSMSLRLGALTSSFFFLQRTLTFVPETIAKWREESTGIRVRDYPQLAREPPLEEVDQLGRFEAELERVSVGGHMASGAGAAGILMGGAGWYYKLYPPTMRKALLTALLFGALESYLSIVLLREQIARGHRAAQLEREEAEELAREMEDRLEREMESLRGSEDEDERETLRRLNWERDQRRLERIRNAYGFGEGRKLGKVEGEGEGRGEGSIA